MPRKADLTPPLGWKGGPCKVVERIENTVRDPRVRHDLAEKVEHGQKLTNPEAAKVYPFENEKGGGMFRSIRISPHAQYRMDQRAITVGDIRVALMNFSRQLNNWRSQKSWEWQQFERDTQRGEPIEWVDKKLGDLKVVFRNERGTAVIISTFWQGVPDPRPEACGTHPRHAGILPETEGVRTLVKNPKPQESDTGRPEGDDGKYPSRALPSPPWSKSRPPHAPVFNVPGESGSNSDGTVHKDKVRTKGTPGGQYDGGKTHPDTPARTTPVRRPGMTAAEDFEEDLILAGYQPRYPSPHPSGQQRQRDQKGQVKRYDSKRYRRLKGKIKRRVKQRYNRLKNNRRFLSRREKARDLSSRHTRRPGGGARTIAERSHRQREKAKRAFSALAVPFFHFPSEEWATITEVTPEGTIQFQWQDGAWDALFIEDFFEEAVLDDEALEDLIHYMDGVFGDEGGDALEDEGEDEDPRFDTWFTSFHPSGLTSSAQTFLRDQRPPEMAPDTKFDRGTAPDKAREDRKELRKRHPGDPSWYNFQDSVSGNPGSRVLPSGAGHVEKQAALIRDIREGCSSDLLARSAKVKFRLARVDSKNALWLFRVPGSKGASYQVRLKATRKGNIRDMQKAHVKVSCSCPFWQWQGPEHWAKQGDYLLGKPRGLATRPGVQDPNGQHRACKHVLAVLSHVASREWSLPANRNRRASHGAYFDQFERRVRRVATRYLASKEMRDA